MKFTGKNLVLVRSALDLALKELQNEIVTCPNVFEYAEDLETIEIEKAQIEKLIARIDSSPAFWADPPYKLPSR